MAPNSTYIAPLRNAGGSNLVYYDSVTKEVTYNPAPLFPQIDHGLGSNDNSISISFNITFQNAPSVILTPINPNRGNPNYSPVLMVSNVTTSNFEMGAFVTNGFNVRNPVTQQSFYWLAIGT